MERLKLRYEIIEKALNAFKKSVDRLETANKNFEKDSNLEEDYRSARDSAIKRFEISLDTLWKYLKIYLEVKIGLTQSSPKPIFRECLRVELINEKDTTEALKMIDARNMTSHIYKEEIAEQLSSNLSKYYDLMWKFINLMKL